MKIVFSRGLKILAALSLVTVSALSAIGWSAATAQRSGQPNYLPLSMSINQLMVAVVDDAAHSIWDGGNTNKRLTDRQWQTIEEHTFQLQAAATLTSLGGTGKADPGWTASPDFQKWCRKLSDAAINARKAVQTKNQMELRNAGDNLLETCAGCHKEFKPDLPTEGIVHVPHYGER